MYESFIAHIKKHRLITQKSTLLLAVSGGIDSIVLTHLFAQTRYPFAIAHAHFGLRGKAADQDAHFVRQLANQHNVPFHLKQFATTEYAKQHHLSIQMAARTLRYTWFDTLLKSHNYTHLITGHHHSDQLETFLHHIVRGTSIAGLRGMPAQRNNIVRPLLFATKAQLTTYATKNKLPWREDTSNQTLKYKRNKLRHAVIPLLKEMNPNLEKTFKSTLTKLSQVDQVFQAYANQLKKQVWHHRPPYYHLFLTPLQHQPWAPIILHHWLSPFGFSFDALQKWWLAPPQVGKKHHTTTHWLLAERKHWLLGPNQKKTYLTYPITTLPIHLTTGNHHTFSISTPHRHHQYTPTPPHIATLDHNKLTFPLTLRPWQAGDTFSPLGMSGKHKKLSDFLIDRKIPLYQKEQVYVLISATQIAWVVGHQIDDRFKVTPATQWQIQAKSQPPTTTPTPTKP